MSGEICPRNVSQALDASSYFDWSVFGEADQGFEFLGIVIIVFLQSFCVRSEFIVGFMDLSWLEVIGDVLAGLFE